MNLTIKKTNIPIYIVGALFSLYIIRNMNMFVEEDLINSLFNFFNNILYFAALITIIYKIKFNSKLLLALTVVITIFMVVFSQTGFTELIRNTLLIILVKNENFDSLITHLRKVSFVFLCSNLFLVVTNYFAHFMYVDKNWYGSLPILMFLYPFLVIVEKHGILQKKEKIKLFIIMISSYFFNIQITALILTTTAIILCGSKIYNNIYKFKFFKFILYICPAICLVFSLFASYQYPNNKIIQVLDNSIFNHRFMMNYRSLLNWPLTLFGNGAKGLFSTTGNFFDPVTNMWSSFNTVDNVYVILMIYMGIAAIIVIGIAYIILIKKTLGNQRKDIALILIMLCIMGLFESNVSSIFISFPFLYLCSMENVVKR